MIKLGNKVLVSDPCYENDIRCTEVVENVKEGNYTTNVAYWKDSDPVFNNRVAELEVILDGVDKDTLNWEITEADISVDSGKCGIYDYKSVKDIVGTGECNEKDTFYGQACQCTDAKEQYSELNSYGVVSRSGIGDGSYDLYIAKQDNQVVGIKIVYLDKEMVDLILAITKRALE